VIGPVGVGVEVGIVVDEVGKVVGVVDDVGVCISEECLCFVFLQVLSRIPPVF
jgi:hypothetical protein